MIFYNPFKDWTEFPKMTDKFGVSQKFGVNPDKYKVITYYPNDPKWPSRPINGHDGIDISCHKGSKIYPMAAGKCEWAGTDSSGGLGVKLRSPDPDDPTLSWEHIYWHNLKNLAVVGQTYGLDDQIAEADDTGWSTGTHLHAAVRQWSTVKQNDHPYEWLRNIVGYYNGFLGYQDFEIKPRNMTNAIIVTDGNQYGIVEFATTPDGLETLMKSHGLGNLPRKENGNPDWDKINELTKAYLVYK